MSENKKPGTPDLDAIRRDLAEWRDGDMEPAIHDREAERLIGHVRPLVEHVDALQAKYDDLLRRTKFLGESEIAAEVARNARKDAHID